MRILVYRFTGRHGPFRVPERWCEECDLMIGVVRRVAAEFPEARVEVKPWFVHLPAALLRGVWHPPGLLVDGRRVVQGRVPTEEEVRSALRAARDRAAAVPGPLAGDA